MNVPGLYLHSLELKAVPLGVPRGDADLAVLAHHPGQVHALDDNVFHHQGQVVPGERERSLLPDEPGPGGLHDRGERITGQ